METWSSWLAEVGVESTRARSASALVLGHQRGGGDLGDHQAGVETEFLRQESRQAEGERRIDQQRDAALGDRADLANGDGDLVGGEGDRLGVEIAARDVEPSASTSGLLSVTALASVSSVRAAMRKVEAGAVDLRLAADAIRVLRAPSPSRWLSRISDPFSKARKAAAVSIWPRWPRNSWISAWNGAEEPLAASVESAPVINADCAARWARNRPVSASAVETCVPLISASPSLAASTTGVGPVASAAAAGMRSPATETSPAPIAASHVGEQREVARGADRDPFRE